MFHYTVPTNKSMSDAVSSLESTLKEEGFGVLWQFDVQAKLQEKGLDFNQPYQILEVCNPNEANRIIKANKLVGYFLPCKIAVYEEEGTTKIGMPKPTSLIEMTNDDNIKNIAEEIEKRLITCIENAK